MPYSWNIFTNNFDKTGTGGTPVIPPDVPQQIITDDGTVVPTGNSFNLVGASLPDPSVIDDNDNGIETYANPDLSVNAAIFLTNRKIDTGSVTGAITADIFTQDLGATPGTYNFQVYVTGFESTTPAGCAFTVFGSVRTTGAAATVIVQQDIIADREAALLTADFALVVSGNNVIARVTGVAGLTINFKVLANYIFIG